MVAVAAVAVTACTDSDPNAVAMVAGQRFDPETLTVAVETTVTWTNEADDPHTVTAYEDDVPPGEYFASGGFSSERAARDDLARGLLEKGDSFEVTFDEPGTYRYFCIPHERDGMVGTIVVEAG